MSSTARTMIIGLVVSISALAVAVALVYASVMGSLSDFFEGDPPRESDPAVVAARDLASDDLAAESEVLLAKVGTVLGGSAQSIATGEEHVPCREGQDNWKFKDPFDLLCTLRHVEVVAVPDASAFRAQMASLDVALRAHGWFPSGSFAIDRVLADYWDQRASYGPGYGVDNLPTATYAQGSADERHTLTVQWAVVSSAPYQIGSEEYSTLRDRAGSDVTPTEVIATIPAAGYAVVLTESVDYFVG